MHVSRRRFLALGSAAALLPLHSRSILAEASEWDCVILDLEKDCSLPESLKGYQRCLTDLGFRNVTVTPAMLPDLLGRARQLVIPAAASTDAALARHLLGVLENGGSILWESGLAFVAPAIFNAQRKLLQSCFDLSIQPPKLLWSENEVYRIVPYVDYLWPQAMKVRDFSRVLPISASGWEVIATVPNAVVGTRRKIGKGAITFLGSPLGPALLAGDEQARQWLGKVLFPGNKISLSSLV